MTPIEEYLHTSYRPECEYVDGEVRERNWREYTHSRMQALVLLDLFNCEAQSGLTSLLNCRFRVSPSRIRVPDLCFLRKGHSQDPILVEPPAIVIEILSPQDDPSQMQERIADYARTGVPHIWRIDPFKKVVYRGKEKVADGILRAEEYGVVLPVPELFEKLNAEE